LTGYYVASPRFFYNLALKFGQQAFFKLIN